MAQVPAYFDAFEYGGSSGSGDVTNFWNLGGNGGGSSLTPAAGGRNGRKGTLTGSNTPPTAQLVPGLFAVAANVIGGVSACINASGATATRDSFHLTTSAGTIELSVRLNASGQVEVRRGQGGTVLCTSTTVTSFGSWVQFSLSFKIDASAGYVNLYINGGTSPEATFSGNTSASGSSNAIGGIRLEGYGNGGGTVAFCEIYIGLGDNGSAALNNPGDVRVDAIYPTGAGNTTQMTASTGSNWQCVDDAQENGDTDYVSETTTGEKDTYAYGDLTPTSGTVLAVMPVVWARKTDAGTRQVCSVARSGGTDTDGTTYNVSQEYGPFLDLRATKPGGGSWSISDVNSAEFGAKLVA